MITHVLVASPKQDALDLVKSAFSKSDIAVARAPGMSLALFLAQKNMPALIFSELDLLDGDGMSFLQEIKASDQLRAIPFVFLLRVKVSEALEADLLRQGASAVISNTIEAKDLFALIEKFLKVGPVTFQPREDDTTE